MMISPENLKAVKKGWIFNNTIVDTVNEINAPICPVCGEPLILIKKYVYKSNCKHINKNINIGYLGEIKNE